MGQSYCNFQSHQKLYLYFPSSIQELFPLFYFQLYVICIRLHNQGLLELYLFFFSCFTYFLFDFIVQILTNFLELFIVFSYLHYILMFGFIIQFFCLLSFLITFTQPLFWLIIQILLNCSQSYLHSFSLFLSDINIKIFMTILWFIARLSHIKSCFPLIGVFILLEIPLLDESLSKFLILILIRFNFTGIIYFSFLSSKLLCKGIPALHLKEEHMGH